jgi:hypothetical protein
MVIAAGVAAGVGFARMQGQMAAAAEESAKLREAVRLLAEIRQAGNGAGRVAVRLEGSDLNRRIREAAILAGISERLASVEPSRPARMGESDYNELMVFVRFDNVELKQLGSFMHRLCAIDPSCRIKTIELETPVEGAADQRWTSDVTLAYLSYAPKENSAGEAR